MVNSSNFTDYGIHNTGERSVWIIFLLLVLLSSLIGDSIILISSIRYNAIKLYEFLVVVIQHIAACDILSSISYVFPTMVSLIANKWVLGDFVARAQYFLDLYSVSGSNIFICALTCSKLMMLQYPLKIGLWTTRKGHIVCSAIWLISLIILIVRSVLLGSNGSGPIFNYKSYSINFYGSPSEYSWREKLILNGMNVVIRDIPVVLTIIATCFTAVHLFRSRKAAARSGGRQRWQGLVTVVATATVYCLSIIPYRVTVTYMFLKPVHGKKVPWRISIFRFTESLKTLNIMSNFIIYSITIPSFWQFLKSRILKKVTRTCEATP
jgi:hypothetical protein